MLGFYDYTVWLTYLSLVSAGLGIIVSLNGSGHPYIGVFFLLICGLCDAFDGRVARSKPNRTKMEKAYGVQIDSLADMVAFGVLPACIGNAMLRVFDTLARVSNMPHIRFKVIHFYAVCIAIMLFYVLAALIRLAYFNVTEEERQEKEGGCRKVYEGLPVTSASLIFPIILTLQYLVPVDITPVYILGLLITGILFISRFKLPKPGLRGIMIMIGIGAVDFVIMMIAIYLKWR